MLFDTGEVTISENAQTALTAAKVDPQSLLARHRSGDWGDVSEFRRQANRLRLNQIGAGTLESGYTLYDTDDLILIITAPDRRITRILMQSEYARIETDTRSGYAHWAAIYDLGVNPLIAIEETLIDDLIAALPFKTALDARHRHRQTRPQTRPHRSQRDRHRLHP